MLTITEAAGRKLTDIIRQQTEQGEQVYGLRISASPGCCSGAQYGMSLAKQAEQGDWDLAAGTFSRVVGTADPALHTAALIGLAECRYRLDQESSFSGACVAVISACSASWVSISW